VQVHQLSHGFFNPTTTTKKDHMKNNIIELPTSELKTALQGLGKIIGRRTTLPVLSAVKVARDQAGIITLHGTDLDSTATFTLKDKSAGPVAQLLVPFERLQKAVKQSNGKVELSLNGKDEVTVRTFWRDTPMEEKVQVPYNDDWPKLPVVEDQAVKLDVDFRDTWKQAMECASEDESRAVLNSVYLDVADKKGHYVVATNGRHMFSANSFMFGFKQSVIIPTRKFLSWNGWWTEGEATLAIKAPVKANDATWLQFTANQWTLLTRGQDQPYPNWKNAVALSEPKTTVIIPQQAIGAMLEVIARLPGEELPNRDVKINTSHSTLVLQGRTKEQDHIVSVPIVEAEVKGEPVVVTVNRDYLTRALRFGLNEIAIVDELTPLILKTEGKRMIVMPIHPGPRAATATAQAKAAAPVAPPPTSTATPPAQNNAAPVQQEERTTMPRQTTTAATTEEQQDSPMKQLVQQIENIKETLKGVITELSLAADVVKKAEKEKKHTEKEIDAIRGKLRQIQNVSI
jgi:DNA polymerase III sliding clamp (beta) subunit (PCNA family)